jgi:hypothetical protein
VCAGGLQRRPQGPGDRPQRRHAVPEDRSEGDRIVAGLPDGSAVEVAFDAAGRITVVRGTVAP